MTTDQFRKDYRQMTAQGVKFTPGDIIRLNALSVRARLSRSAASSTHLPRLCFLPRDSWWREPITLREPTIAHDLWIEAAERYIDVERIENWLFLHAFALSRRIESLPDIEKPKKVISAVFRFAASRLCRFTHAQLSAAVDYALYGADWTACERPLPERNAKDGIRAIIGKPNPEKPSPSIGLLVSRTCLRLPITLDEARRMTASELEEAINRTLESDGRFDADRSHAKAFRDYVKAREEIRARFTESGKSSQGGEA